MSERFLIVNSAEPGITEFVRPIEEILEGPGIKFQTIEYAETLNTDINTFRGVIISGSPRGNDIVDHHLPYFQWIKTTGVAVLGICAGHHILGRLYGSEILRSVEKEVGDFPVFIDQGDPVFSGFPQRFTVAQNHHDSITMPEGFKRLAYSDTCQVEGIRHNQLPLYSFQFHPEIHNPGLLLNFVDIASKQI
jgi:GMP synthase (glutamine-hydrolysing)